MTWSRSGTSARAARLPPGWHTRYRPAVFARNGDVCYLCGKPGADTIDHKRRGDDHSLANLAPVHDRNPPHCHRAKTAREGVLAKPSRKRRPPRHPSAPA